MAMMLSVSTGRPPRLGQMQSGRIATPHWDRYCEIRHVVPKKNIWLHILRHHLAPFR